MKNKTPRPCNRCFWWDEDYRCANKHTKKIGIFCYGYDNKEFVENILIDKSENEKNKKDI